MFFKGWPIDSPRSRNIAQNASLFCFFAHHYRGIKVVYIVCIVGLLNNYWTGINILCKAELLSLVTTFALPNSTRGSLWVFTYWTVSGIASGIWISSPVNSTGNDSAQSFFLLVWRPFSFMRLKRRFIIEFIVCCYYFSWRRWCHYWFVS